MPLSPAALEPLLELALIEGVGPSRLAALIGSFGSAEGVLRAHARDLSRVPGVPAMVAGRIAGAGAAERRATRAALRALRRVDAFGIVPDDPAYPESFRLLPDPPYLLFGCGNPDLVRAPAIAVVGTRTPTAYGRQATRDLAGAVARSGYAIVSGMARGIDTLAHQAALDARGATIGVLGNGIEQIYPPENRSLFAAVREHGLLLSEFVPGETPKAGNFPRRNRLIVALGSAVLVVEMGLRSGAQHTVTYALEQGRDVFAVPGPIDSPTSEGTNQLIKEGARMVTSVHDVLEELNGVGSVRPERIESPEPPSEQAALPLLSDTESRVFSALESAPRHVDELCSETSLSSSVLLGTLLELEIRGIALALPGMHYRRA
jgi:DNA processing protein